MIALDANGADAGPAKVAEGARLSGERVLLFGPASEVGDADERVEVVDAPLAIAGGEEPVRAVRSAPDASIVQAARAVGEGRAEALVSAGSTGPTLAAGTLSIKRLHGVFRPALAVLIPVPGGIGAAEASLSAALIAMGVDEPTAFAIALTQRLCTFYLPPIWGFVSLRWLSRKGYL